MKHNITHSQKWSSLEMASESLKKNFRESAILSNEVIEKLTSVVDELLKFPLGQHILLTKGANGIWTDYMIAYPWVHSNDNKNNILNALEHYIIFEMPHVRAQRELFLYSQKVAQAHVKENSILMSIPCGVMRDLLTLDFAGIQNYTLVGVDVDEESLNAAKRLANQQKVANVQFFHENAWEFVPEKQADFINSIGLNVYENNRERVISLYHQFFNSLKPNGVLFTGVLTYPPGKGKKSNWKVNDIPNAHLEMEKLLVNDVLDLSWQNYRTLKEMKEDFFKAGFSRVDIIPDKHCIFPSVIATK